MKVRQEDYRTILEHLVEKRWEGEEFVAFSDNTLPVSKSELFTFQSQYEAQEYCHEMATDLDSYNYLSVRSAIRTMEEGLRDKTLLIERDGIIDVALMVAMRYQRLEAEQLINNQKLNIMNEENFEYLSNQVKFSGFGDSLNENLREAMQKNEATFTLVHQPDFANGDLKATLHFRRSDETGMVFFNRYELELKQSAETMKQTFFMGKENNFTLKEAFNMMEGRAVYKEREKLAKVGEGESARFEGSGEKYNAWIQLDFKDADENGNFKLKSFHDNYGFDLSESLSKLPIKELDDTEKKSQMLRSLERGNLHQITYIKEGEEMKGSVMAVPQFKTVKMFDEKGKELRSSQREAQDNKQSEKQGQKQDTESKKKVARAAGKKNGIKA